MSTRLLKIVGLRIKMLLPQRVKLAGSLDFCTCRKKTISTEASLRMSKRLQIDPLLLLRSNRKPGSWNWLQVFPPYFYSRLFRYSPLEASIAVTRLNKVYKCLVLHVLLCAGPLSCFRGPLSDPILPPGVGKWKWKTGSSYNSVLTPPNRSKCCPSCL